ncbi:hypothetical protein QE443_003490 [Pantoea ananatis]|jgi:hypothetical protein|nr:hypothetical protein [Pantoea ananatis]MDR6092491.1 hypothetical protein [Pantoea ananatis]PVY84618.1 hypothetical protein C7427_104246 [Pantoea ananatis]PWV64115.1 hypothetical protein C7425_10640 [Pantoea ananatis]PXW03542.1 hypothetical protein C7422_102249 [Pantoea ananatis]
MCYCPRPCQSSLCQKSVAYQVINPALHFMTIQHVQAATCLQGARLNAFFQPNGSNPAYIICCFNVAERFKTIVQELIKCLSFFNLSFYYVWDKQNHEKQGTCCFFSACAEWL